MRKQTTKEELGQLYPVDIVAYDPSWTNCFSSEDSCLQDIFGQKLEAEHIGSTAVPEISAKPTVDIVIEKPKGITDEFIMEILSGRGYIHMTEVRDYLMFVKGYGLTGLNEVSYHIHMISLDSNWCRDRVAFRDWLRQNGSVRDDYQKLKEELVVEYRNDRDAYTRAKAEFVREVPRKARAGESQEYEYNGD